jgi:GT2 family glycosyltransferase
MRSGPHPNDEPAPQARQPVPADSGVTVVIPTFNRADDVQLALANLAAQPGCAVHVIVVDNSSTDGTEQMVARAQAEWGTRLTYIRKSPQGPASARNVGLAMAQTPYVLFHDSDVELSVGWIIRARTRLESEARLAAVGGYIVYAFEPGRVNAFGGDLNWFGLAWDVDEGAAYSPASAPAERIWINCSAMLVRREAAIAAGGFDETFFYGFEDTDLGWRLRILGHGVAVVPDLVARHKVDPAPGAAHPDIVFHYCKNRLRMLLRNAQPTRLPWMLAGYLLYSALDLVLRAPRAPKLRALAWNLAQWRSTLALRKAVQLQRRCSDREIFASSSGRWFPPTRLGGLRRRPTAGAAAAAGALARPRVDDRV